MIVKYGRTEGEQKEFNIGSQAAGFNPFFCNANQTIQLNGTIGAYKACL